MAFVTALVPAPQAGRGIPYEHIEDTFGNTLDIHTRAWTAYTPVWTNGVLGNGILEGKGWQLGKYVAFRIDLVWGSTTSSSGGWSFSLPVAAVATRSYSVGSGEYVDASPASSGAVRARITSASTITVLAGSSQLSPTAPITWASGDEMHITGWYEAQ